MEIFQLLRKFKRKFLIKWYGLKNVHPTFLTTFGLRHVSKDLKAGKYSYVGPGCIIYPNTIIGDYTLLANDVMIIGGDHDFRKAGVPLPFAGREPQKTTIIGSDVWIGARSTIFRGIKIGNGAIIAAGSVVTKDVEPYWIVGGVPARPIRKRFNDDEIEIHEQMLSLKDDFSENLLSSGNDLFNI